MLRIAKSKPKSLVVLLVTVLMLLQLTAQFAVTAKAQGYTEYTGTLGGAHYVVRFPDTWNGILAIVCRGYSHTPILDARTSLYNATSTQLLSQRFAVAASAYSAGGYCIKAAMNDTYELTKYLVNKYLISGKVYLIGVSMGGNVALMLGEKYPDVYSGVLDNFGPKDVADQYYTKTRWAALSDAELTSELTALTAPVPPLGFSNLTMLRGFYATSAADIALETGGTPDSMPTVYEDISPMYHANITIPVITLHGTSDALVPLQQTLMYQDAVAKAGRSSLYRVYIVGGGQHGSPSISSQTPSRLAELVAWSNEIGEYRGWKVVPSNGRLYIVPPPSTTGIAWPQQIGTWDAQYYASIGKTIVDAAKPSIDESISNCGSRYPTS